MQRFGKSNMNIKPGNHRQPMLKPDVVTRAFHIVYTKMCIYLSLQVDHLTRKPKDGERSLREILSILHENDISPFEVTQSGLVPALLTFLTKKVSTKILGDPNA